MRNEAIGRPMEILLVEDSLMSARLTMGALKNCEVQHRLTWLKDGNDASEFLNRRGIYAQAPRPDLILLDLELPGKDGRQLLQEVRENNDIRETPVVILTDAFYRRQRWQAAVLTAHGGVIVMGLPTVMIGETGQGSTLQVAAQTGAPFCEV